MKRELAADIDHGLPALPGGPALPFRVDSETARLNAVLLASPAHLELLPCNAMSTASLRAGHRTDRERAIRQHRALRRALADEGVAAIDVPARPGLADIVFTRDTSLMTPWGLVGLRPGAPHRREEVDAVLAAAASHGIPLLGRIGQGRIEGGDIAIVRRGLLLIGLSGDRTDDAGAEALGGMFRARGWRVMLHRFAPEFLHIDTLFSMVDQGLALGCVDILGERFVAALAREGVEILPVARDEAGPLGCNILALGDRRVVIPEGCGGIASLLSARGYRPIAVDVSEFLQCGGGIHCLSMPLDRAPG